MKTLYIDVYFMINFTVDILAIFIALRMVHVKINIRRLIFSGLLGASLAILELFLKNKAIHILVAALFVMLITIICCKEVSFFRKIKFLISFYISTFLISGAVNFIYSVMDRYLEKIILKSNESANRKVLVFSLIILMMIGVLRLFVMMFSSSINEKSARILIEIADKTLAFDAMIDTGNLVKDPMNMNPVIFIKENLARQILPAAVIELSNIDSLTSEYRKRIRLIPVTRNAQTHVMTGVRADRVTIFSGDTKEQINASIVIDKEGGTFGGYYALAPYVAVCNNG